MARIILLWIVTKPTLRSTLQDICFQTDLAQGLRNQYVGGMDPNTIVGFYDNQAEAELLAQSLIRIQQGVAA